MEIHPPPRASEYTNVQVELTRLRAYELAGAL